MNNDSRLTAGAAIDFFSRSSRGGRLINSDRVGGRVGQYCLTYLKRWASHHLKINGDRFIDGVSNVDANTDQHCDVREGARQSDSLVVKRATRRFDMISKPSQVWLMGLSEGGWRAVLTLYATEFHDIALNVQASDC